MSRLPAKLLDGMQRSMTIERMFHRPSGEDSFSSIENGERSLLCWVLPPWQRPEVWDQRRKRAFVEAIFLGLGTGTYVVHQENWDNNGRMPMSGWLIDGQQRVSALRDFVAGDLDIFDGVRHSDLNEIELRRRFYQVVFPCIEIEYQPDEARLRELYERLNFGGVAHTQEDLDRLGVRTPMFEALRERGS